MDDKSYIADRCKAYLDQHLEQAVELQDIELYMGYSKFYLNRIFSEQYGTTMQQYRKKKRLKLAAEKLADTEEEIAQIALEAGYQSQQAFTLAFGRQFGCPPAEYRRTYGFLCVERRCAA